MSGFERAARPTALSRSLAARAAESEAGWLRVGHRGLAALCAENTLASFRAGVASGAAMIEFDVRLSADGVPVCVHDATLDRTTDAVAKWGPGPHHVADYSASRLLELDAGRWHPLAGAGERIPTLEAALTEIHAGSLAMIEHKAGPAAPIVDIVKRLDLTDAVILQSFDWAWLREIRALLPTATLGALGGIPERPNLDAATRAELTSLDVQMVHWNFTLLDAATVTALRAAQYLTCTYTVDSRADQTRLAGWGVELITTNG